MGSDRSVGWYVPLRTMQKQAQGDARSINTHAREVFNLWCAVDYLIQLQTQLPQGRQRGPAGHGRRQLGCVDERALEVQHAERRQPGQTFQGRLPGSTLTGARIMQTEGGNQFNQVCAGCPEKGVQRVMHSGPEGTLLWADHGNVRLGSHHEASELGASPSARKGSTRTSSPGRKLGRDRTCSERGMRHLSLGLEGAYRCMKKQLVGVYNSKTPLSITIGLSLSVQKEK